MLQSETKTQILKLAGLGALSLGLNYLIFGKLLRMGRPDPQNPVNKAIINEVLEQEKDHLSKLTSLKLIKSVTKNTGWGSVKLLDQAEEDALIKELKMMDSLLFEVSRVNNLIVDLELHDFKPYRNHLVTDSIKKKKQQPFLSADTLLAPGEFVIKQCRFTPGNTLELEKKYLRAGPRGSEFFDPSQVNADIVCLGNTCPGINTIIRELFLMLKCVYKVNKVTGVKNSLRGYYQKKFVELTEQKVETIHHYGSCYLGLSKSEVHVSKIVDSLVSRNVNQLYLIGANKTMNLCQELHKQIKQRKLAISVCVILKGINRDIPIFDICFGFETAVEQGSKVIEKAYSFSHSHENGISLVKLPGYNTGFLASCAVLSTVNANICLVPEFEYDMFGPKGLLSCIAWRVKNKGSCTVVYAEGAEKSIRDCCIKKSEADEAVTEFDIFLKRQIERRMKAENITPFQVGIFNAVEVARMAPANAFDTKLCSQISQSSIMGVMAGYTNFAVGHLSNKSTMISVDELLMSESVTQLREYDEIWQQTIMTTGQPRLLNENFVLQPPV